jgi:hypothetical protein
MRFLRSLFLASFLFITACAHQPSNEAIESPGFRKGFVHGLIAPIALWGELFMDIRIYAFPNSGFSYDWGFLFGCLCWAYPFAEAYRRGEQEEDENEIYDEDRNEE